jgi:hypothetical protein
MGEDITCCVRIVPPGDEPVSGRLDMFDGLRDSKLDLQSCEELDLAVVIGDSETARDDVVKVDH